MNDPPILQTAHKRYPRRNGDRDKSIVRVSGTTEIYRRAHPYRLTPLHDLNHGGKAMEFSRHMRYPEREGIRKARRRIGEPDLRFYGIDSDGRALTAQGTCAQQQRHEQEKNAGDSPLKHDRIPLDSSHLQIPCLSIGPSHRCTQPHPGYAISLQQEISSHTRRLKDLLWRMRTGKIIHAPRKG